MLPLLFAGSVNVQTHGQEFGRGFNRDNLASVLDICIVTIVQKKLLEIVKDFLFPYPLVRKLELGSSHLLPIPPLPPCKVSGFGGKNLGKLSL